MSRREVGDNDVYLDGRIAIGGQPSEESQKVTENEQALFIGSLVAAAVLGGVLMGGPTVPSHSNQTTTHEVDKALTPNDTP